MFLVNGSHSVVSLFPVIPTSVKRKKNRKQCISELRWVNILFNGSLLDLSNEDYFSSIIWCVLLCYLPMMCPGLTHWVLAPGYVSKNYRKMSNSCLKVLHNLSNNKLKWNIFEAHCIRDWYGSFTGKECFQGKREDKYFFTL